MKTEELLNKEINEITLKIQNEYPELSIYIAEMPVTMPNVSSPKINTETLSDYLESLKILLKDYVINHNKSSENFHQPKP